MCSYREGRESWQQLLLLLWRWIATITCCVLNCFHINIETDMPARMTWCFTRTKKIGSSPSKRSRTSVRVQACSTRVGLHAYTCPVRVQACSTRIIIIYTYIILRFSDAEISDNQLLAAAPACQPIADLLTRFCVRKTVWIMGFICEFWAIIVITTVSRCTLCSARVSCFPQNLILALVQKCLGSGAFLKYEGNVWHREEVAIMATFTMRNID